MSRSLVSTALVLLLFVASEAHAATASPVPARSVTNAPTTADDTAIRKLLSSYTTSVTNGDQAAFESQLLDRTIPFSHVDRAAPSSDRSGLARVQNYDGFRQAIFGSGKKYQQRFSNVRIEQVGNLAQVSLDYETALQGEAYDGKGWKVLHLVKLDGAWKIASEFYTGYPAR